MYLILFFLSCAIALTFIILGENSKRQWVRKSFRIYSLLFTVVTVLLFTFNLSQNKTVISNSYKKLFQKDPSVLTTSQQLTSQYSIKGAVFLKAPLIQQLPELPRGCEITSLAMLLKYHDVNVDKMQLAKQIKKDNSSYKEIGEEVHFGNPHDGFVGDMYTFDKPGLGVYHGPIRDLAEQYIDKERINDFTGQEFETIINHLNEDSPVWVIINAAYDELPETSFMTWQTKSGPVKVTMREHSVLITGYDDRYIYFNDPLNRETKAPIDNFRRAWEQMGKQAITIK